MRTVMLASGFLDDLTIVEAFEQDGFQALLIEDAGFLLSSHKN